MDLKTSHYKNYNHIWWSFHSMHKYWIVCCRSESNVTCRLHLKKKVYLIHSLHQNLWIENSVAVSGKKFLPLPSALPPVKMKKDEGKYLNFQKWSDSWWMVKTPETVFFHHWKPLSISFNKQKNLCLSFVFYKIEEKTSRDQAKGENWSFVSFFQNFIYLF